MVLYPSERSKPGRGQNIVRVKRPVVDQFDVEAGFIVPPGGAKPPQHRIVPVPRPPVSSHAIPLLAARLEKECKANMTELL